MPVFTVSCDAKLTNPSAHMHLLKTQSNSMNPASDRLSGDRAIHKLNAA